MAFKINPNPDSHQPHPGKIVEEFLIEEEHVRFIFSEKEGKHKAMLYTCSGAEKLNVKEDFLIDFIDGKKDIDYLLAYKLVKAFPVTSMEFWLHVQARYDVEKHHEELKRSIGLGLGTIGIIQ